MSSDPSTKDLIETARENYAHRSGCRYKQGYGADPLECATCLRLALADRLEEVEEERRSEKALAWWCGPLPDEQGDYTGAPLLTTEEWLAEEAARRGRQVIPLRPVSASPEPSDPEPDRWEPFPNDEDLAAIIGEDPEPDDDPDDLWESVELRAKAGRFEARALVDLRKRVEENDDRAYQAVRQNDRKIAALKDRVEEIDSELDYAAERAGKLKQIARDTHTRLTTLEGHADRGAEAEAELSGRVGRLEDKERSALRARATLRDDLEKVDDHTEALAERVEALEREGPVQAACGSRC